MSEEQKFYGKYRGKAEDNRKKPGHLLVSCPAVFNEGKKWATPCVPFAGRDVGFFAMPPEGANVWVEFEEGDPEKPIWSGCFWDNQQAPPVSSPEDAPQTKVIKTDSITLTLSDKKEVGFMLEVGKLKLVLNSQGIELRNGDDASIKLTAAGVSVNNGALEVMK